MKDARTAFVLVLLAVFLLFLPSLRRDLEAQFMAHDPGPRGAPVGAGTPIPALTHTQLDFFVEGKTRFSRPHSVSGRLPGESGTGLGPRYNLNGCGGCHSQPAIGGTSPSTTAYPYVGPNPQVAVATLDGAVNTVPSFITEDGPIREAHFKYFLAPGGGLSDERDGGEYDLYTIQGRVDATNVIGITGHLQTCYLAQPDFAQMEMLNNVSLRIPTPLFGAGLIENIADATLIDNLAANAALKKELGISGSFNRGVDGTINRFGWKAIGNSLLPFAGEAATAEIGVSNEVIPTKLGSPLLPPVDCLFNGTPEDHIHMTPGESGPATPSSFMGATNFMRFLDQPKPACEGAGCPPAVQNGRRLFSSLGCALCHTPTLKTTVSSLSNSLSNANANLYSDLALHHMGLGLADDIIQGSAGPDQFRTAPLWGLGQRVFFLHDGRTQDLIQAIEQHASPGSEAGVVVQRYNHLTEGQKQDLLDFLRSL